MTNPMTILIGTDIKAENVQRIRAHIAEHGYPITVIYRPDLLAPATYPAEHNHAPDLTPAQLEEWRGLLRQADIMFDFDTLTLPHWVKQNLVPRLRWLQTTSAGVGPAIKAAGLDKTDLIVTTASGVHAGPLAEYVFMALLMWVKDYSRMARQKEERIWQKFSGDELYGKTLMIIGPGRIGSHIATMAHTFGMRVIAAPHTHEGRKPADYNADELISTESTALRTALARTDALVLACPLTPQTRGLIGSAELAAMPQGSYLINIARGPVVDEADMIAALKSRHLAGAALDVFETEPLPPDSPLWTMPNVIISPHSASNAPAENARLTAMFLHNLDCFVAGRFEDMTPILDKERGY